MIFHPTLPAPSSHHQLLPPLTFLTKHHQTLITLEGTLPTPEDFRLHERIAPPLFEILQGLLGPGLCAVAYRAQLRRLRVLPMRDAICRCVRVSSLAGIGMRNASWFCSKRLVPLRWAIEEAKTENQIRLAAVPSPFFHLGPCYPWYWAHWKARKVNQKRTFSGFSLGSSMYDAARLC